MGRRRRGGLDLGGARRRGTGSGAAMLGEDGEEVRRRSAGSGMARARASRQPGGGMRWFGVGAEERERKKIGEEEENFLSRAYILAPLVPVPPTGTKGLVLAQPRGRGSLVLPRLARGARTGL